MQFSLPVHLFREKTPVRDVQFLDGLPGGQLLLLFSREVTSVIGKLESLRDTPRQQQPSNPSGSAQLHHNSGYRFIGPAFRTTTVFQATALRFPSARF
ncbi:hypothetical protein IC234_02655 [Hymenobacter sp. BT189]|uniref:Uncharacterized protein n=1 Tax=Hymenobacter armeniacus TaxID=2771358 RepID=A0ABR8JLY6_9BACT|nr:hypothetical protein [Hymenobacter armeniacus]